jgi:hypothetical protein
LRPARLPARAAQRPCCPAPGPPLTGTPACTAAPLGMLHVCRHAQRGGVSAAAALVAAARVVRKRAAPRPPPPCSAARGSHSTRFTFVMNHLSRRLLAAWFVESAWLIPDVARICWAGCAARHDMLGDCCWAGCSVSAGAACLAVGGWSSYARIFHASGGYFEGRRKLHR